MPILSAVVGVLAAAYHLARIYTTDEAHSLWALPSPDPNPLQELPAAAATTRTVATPAAAAPDAPANPVAASGKVQLPLAGPPAKPGDAPAVNGSTGFAAEHTDLAASPRSCVPAAAATGAEVTSAAATPRTVQLAAGTVLTNADVIPAPTGAALAAGVGWGLGPPTAVVPVCVSEDACLAAEFAPLEAAAVAGTAAESGEGRRRHESTVGFRPSAVAPVPVLASAAASCLDAPESLQVRDALPDCQVPTSRHACRAASCQTGCMQGTPRRSSTKRRRFSARALLETQPEVGQILVFNGVVYVCFALDITFTLLLWWQMAITSIVVVPHLSLFAAITAGGFALAGLRGAAVAGVGSVRSWLSVSSKVRV